MGRYYEIPNDTFDTLQLDAGVLLKHFDIEAAANDPTTPGFTNADIICATTGGVNPSCVPTFSDFGEDVDNCPVNMKELKHLDSYEVKLSTTSLGTSASLIKMAVGCSDLSEDGKSVIPRADLSQSDFSDLWWVGDKANGGFVAIKILNALSTGGFSLQTTKNGKGQIALTIMGHVSINAQKEVPMEFYSADPTEGVTYTVKQTLSHVTSTFTENAVASGEALEATLTADADYTLANVTVLMDGEDVTDDVYTAGTINIASVTGDVQIIATATQGA